MILMHRFLSSFPTGVLRVDAKRLSGDGSRSLIIKGSSGVLLRWEFTGQRRVWCSRWQQVEPPVAVVRAVQASHLAHIADAQ